eukprot:scaffold71960_cov33-Prasinocladus_malaysianus.AAC.1
MASIASNSCPLLLSQAKIKKRDLQLQHIYQFASGRKNLIMDWSMIVSQRHTGRITHYQPASKHVGSGLPVRINCNSCHSKTANIMHLIAQTPSHTPFIVLVPSARTSPLRGAIKDYTTVLVPRRYESKDNESSARHA